MKIKYILIFIICLVLPVCIGSFYAGTQELKKYNDIKSHITEYKLYNSVVDSISALVMQNHSGTTYYTLINEKKKYFWYNKHCKNDDYDY